RSAEGYPTFESRLCQLAEDLSHLLRIEGSQGFRPHVARRADAQAERRHGRFVRRFHDGRDVVTAQRPVEFLDRHAHLLAQGANCTTKACKPSPCSRRGWSRPPCSTWPAWVSLPGSGIGCWSFSASVLPCWRRCGPITLANSENTCPARRGR